MPSDMISPFTGEAVTSLAEWLDWAQNQGPPIADFAISMLQKERRQHNWPVIHDDPLIQARYVAIRLDGESHLLAEMLAMQQAPTLRTDSTFLEGNCNGNQFENSQAVGDFYAAAATAAGVNVKGAVYKHGLARFPGDPEAWVRSRGDVQRLCEARGWGCQGSVNVKAQDLGPPPADVDVADDIVEQKVLDMIEANPDLERRPVQEVFHEAKEAIKPHWHKT